MSEGEPRNQKRKYVTCPVCADTIVTQGNLTFRHCGKLHVVALNLCKLPESVLSGHNITTQMPDLSTGGVVTLQNPDSSSGKPLEIQEPVKHIRTVFRKCKSCGSQDIVTAQMYKDICGASEMGIEGEEQFERPTVCLNCRELFEG